MHMNCVNIMSLVVLLLSNLNAINALSLNSYNNDWKTKAQKTDERSVGSFIEPLSNGEYNTGLVLIGSFFVGLVVGGFSGSYYTAEQFKRVRRYKGDGNDGSLSNNVPISEIKDLDTCLETIGDLETYHLGEYTNLLNNQQLLKDELLARDYEEFKVPDLNNDDVISYSEFVQHAANYKKGFPDAAVVDFPDFKAMDTNNDEEVSFDEWLKHIMQIKEEHDINADYR